ncbi:hypothetical protein GCM10011499_25930 [Pelagibacterium lentulum]|uniref:Uncharacterized protein n=1 Tax=Pelagibacterium lentulum TaxID=2029865 RepID=A0A916RHK5_9HYPH|nr:hypothetical protein GCM10011499_25930 [Pelagibacterium lentulum]
MFSDCIHDRTDQGVGTIEQRTDTADGGVNHERIAGFDAKLLQVVGKCFSGDKGGHAGERSQEFEHKPKP